MITKPVNLTSEPSLQVRFLFENLVLGMIADDQARDVLHFKYVSPEWVGNPGWYFWPRSRPGVFLLRLESALDAEHALFSHWQLYYYPHPGEDVFECYALDEQLVRLSGLFNDSKPVNSCKCQCSDEHGAHDFTDLADGVGVPDPDVRERLNAWLFYLGDLVLEWQDGKPRCFILEAPAVSCTWSCMDIQVPDDAGNLIPLLKEREMDRNVPAWELCREFADDLLTDLQTIGLKYSLSEETSRDPAGLYCKNVYELT